MTHVWKNYLKTYCCMFYSHLERVHVYEYFNDLEEVIQYLVDNKHMDLYSIQRIRS